MDRKSKVYQSRMARMREEAYVSAEYIDTVCSDAVRSSSIFEKRIDGRRRMRRVKTVASPAVRNS